MKLSKVFRLALLVVTEVAIRMVQRTPEGVQLVHYIRTGEQPVINNEKEVQDAK